MSAIIPAGTEGALAPLNIERALALVNESKDLSELKDIRDQAGLLAGLARSRDASRDVQNGAAELKLRAERRIGEILDEQRRDGERAAGGAANLRRGKAPATQLESPGDAPPPAPAPTLEQLGIDKNLARRTQAIAKMPEKKFETYIQTQKADPAGEITTAGALKVAASRNPHAASRVNDGDPAKNIRFTDPDWAQELHTRFRFTVDAFGQADAPLSKLVGSFYTKQDDGFSQDYTDERVVANPEWPELPEAGHLAHVQAEAGCPLWVLIMPVTQLSRTWCDTFVEPYRPDRGGAGVRLEMPRGRKNYGNPDDPECEDKENKGIGMPSCIVVWEGERRRAPGFPELVDCGCGHLHSEGQPCWCCSCKVGADATAAPNLDRRTSGGARRALVSEASEDMLVDRFRGEAQQLNFSTRVSTGAPELLVRCLAKKCTIAGGERFAFALKDGRVERSTAQLQHLREHVRSHEAGWSDRKVNRLKRALAGHIQPPLKKGRKR